MLVMNKITSLNVDDDVWKDFGKKAIDCECTKTELIHYALKLVNEQSIKLITSQLRNKDL